MDLPFLSKKLTRMSGRRAAPSSSKYDSEEEWSTLKASRPGPDGTLSLTATLRRPLPATRLQQSSKGGARLAMPLYRTIGSSVTARRRAETFLLDSSPRPSTVKEPELPFSGFATEKPVSSCRYFQPTPLHHLERKAAERPSDLAGQPRFGEPEQK